mgnify:FL=1
MRLQEKPLHMDEFIKQCEAFDSITCQSLIDIFEESDNKERVDNFGRPNFTQVNLNQEKKYRKFVQILSYKFIEVFRSYKEGLESYSEWFPHKIFLEELRIKKYEPDSDDMFDLHVDVQDHDTAKRYLAFLCYLNDDFFGGETDFPYHKLTVKPNTGTVLVFPPTWQYPHRGLPVKEGKPKYILSTYLHYH